MDEFSDYIIFADESGDHGLTSINPENPIFVLAFCIFRKEEYISVVKQAISQLKMDFWGHDLVVLHNHEIRKSRGEFSFLFDEEKRNIFLHALNETIRKIPFSIAATAIDKRYVSRDQKTNNPYYLALSSCVEQIWDFLEAKNHHHKLTHIIVESRGKNEDNDLGVAFSQLAKRCPISLRFANKQTNSSGLQIADLVAHPISRYIMRRDQPNKAFEILKEKLLGYPEYEEVGLRAHPQKAKNPGKSRGVNADRELPIHL